jgi:transposase
MLPKLSGKSDLAAAIRYARTLWTALRRYLDDGRLEIDTDVFDKLFFRVVAIVSRHG